MLTAKFAVKINALSTAQDLSARSMSSRRRNVRDIGSPHKPGVGGIFVSFNGLRQLSPHFNIGFGVKAVVHPGAVHLVLVR